MNNIVKKGKDQLTHLRNHNVIYKIDCLDCDNCYIGQTYRALAKRKSEHKSNIKKPPDEHKVITKQIIENEHNINWDNIQIIDKETHDYKRDVSEMLYIKTHKKL